MLSGGTAVPQTVGFLSTTGGKAATVGAGVLGVGGLGYTFREKLPSWIPGCGTTKPDPTKPATGTTPAPQTGADAPAPQTGADAPATGTPPAPQTGADAPAPQTGADAPAPNTGADAPEKK